MLVERVQLENVLSHRSTVIELPRGVVAIIGPNGAGKTSIIDAISYALFGMHSRGAGSRREKEPLIRHGAARARIVVDFTVSGRRYRVEKVFGKGIATIARMSVIDGGKPRLIANSARSVASELRRVLGLDLSVAAELYITRQGELERLLTDRQKRIDVFNAVFGIKKMELAYERLREILLEYRGRLGRLEEAKKSIEKSIARLEADVRELDEARKRLSALRGKLSRIAEELKALEGVAEEYAEAKARLASLRSQYSETVDRIKKLRAERDKLTVELEKVEEARRELERFGPNAFELVEHIIELVASIRSVSERLVMLEKELEARKRELEELEKCGEAAREYDEARKRLEELEKEYNEASRVISEYERLRVEVERKSAEAERLRRSVEKRLSGFSLEQIDTSNPDNVIAWFTGLLNNISTMIEDRRNRIRIIEKEIGRLESQIRDLSGKLKQLTSASGRCPLCGRPLDEQHRLELIKRLRREKEEAEQKRLMLERKKVLLEKEVEELEEKRRFIEEVRLRLQGELANLRVLLDDIEKAKASLEELKGRYLQYQAVIQEYQALRQRVAELEECAWRYRSVPRLRSEVGRVSAEIVELRSKFDGLIGELRRAAEKLGISSADIGTVYSEAKRLRETLRELEARASRYTVYRARLSDIEEELRSAVEAARRLEDEIAALEERVKSLEEEKRRADVLEEERRRLSEEISRLEGRLAVLERKREELEAEKQELARVEWKLKRVSRAVRDLERIRSALDPRKGLPRLVRSRAKSLMEYHLRDILEKFNLGIVDVSLDDEYGVTIHTPTGPRPVGLLSGGERVAVAIAYRLALARTAAGRVDSLIMDEPTIHLDEERRRELVNIIRYGLSSAGLSQLIIVTHDQEVEDAADTVIEVSKNKGYSEVKLRTISNSNEPVALTP